MKHQNDQPKICQNCFYAGETISYKYWLFAYCVNPRKYPKGGVNSRLKILKKLTDTCRLFAPKSPNT